MFKKFIYLASFVLVLSLAGNVQAATSTWTDGDAADHLWSTPGNWSLFPTLADWAKVRNGLPGPTVAGEGAVALKVHVGYSEGGALTVDGGSLTTDQDILLGKNGGTGTINMISGVINCGRDLEVGGGNPGIVNMTGGTINVGDDFMMPEVAGSIADVNLDGGTITVDDDLNMGPGGTINVTAGTLIIDDDVVSTVQGYIDNGWITAYDGRGTFNLDYDTTNRGQTTLTASVSGKASNPNPPDGAEDIARAPTLTWSPGAFVAETNGNIVYYSDDPAAVLNRSAPSMAVTDPCFAPPALLLDLGQPYYWAVDIVNDTNSWPGDLWTFNAKGWLLIDDMEPYMIWSDLEGPWIFVAWEDGTGACPVGNNSGAVLTENTDPVYSGNQSMKYDYDNDGTVYSPCVYGDVPGRDMFSKIEGQIVDLHTGIGTDWTIQDVRALSLRFYGQTGNDPEPMWVKLQDAAKGYSDPILYGFYDDEDPNDITEESWHEWFIDLADFGIDVNNVVSMVVGFGNEDETGDHGSGTVYFDDFRLYVPKCVPARNSAELARLDFAPVGEPDCVVNHQELDVLARNWLERDVLATAQTPAASELLVHWAFDETSGLIASDSSGNGRNGDVNNLSGESWVLDDERGRCLDFSNGDNVRAITDSNVYMDGLDALTVALWVKSNEIGTDSGFIIFEEPMGQDKRDIRYDSVGGDSRGINLIKYGVTVPPDEGVHDGREEDESSAGIQTTSWQHIAMTWQNGVGLKLYIDGALDIPGNDENTRPGLTTGYDILMVGKGSKDEGNTEGWNGRIDDVRIYSYALSQSEIVSVMGLPELYIPITSPAEVYDSEDPGDRAIDFKDYAELVDSLWLPVKYPE